MADYTRCWCPVQRHSTTWRYADDETPNDEPVCTECERIDA